MVQNFFSPLRLRIALLSLFPALLLPIQAQEVAAEATPEATPATPTLTPEQEKAREIMVKANEAYNSQHYTEALTLLDEVEKLVPDDVQVAMMRGGCYAELGKFDEAAKVFQALKEKMPEHFAVQFNLVELKGMQKDYPAAREGFTELLKQFPNSDFVRYKIMLTYLAEWNQAGAIEWFQQIRQRGETPELSYAAAALAISQGKFALSDRLMLEAEQRAPGALRHLYDSLAAIDFVRRAGYPPQGAQGAAAPGAAQEAATPESVLEDDKPAATP